MTHSPLIADVLDWMRSAPVGATRIVRLEVRGGKPVPPDPPVVLLGPGGDFTREWPRRKENA